MVFLISWVINQLSYKLLFNFMVGRPSWKDIDGAESWWPPTCQEVKDSNDICTKDNKIRKVTVIQHDRINRCNKCKKDHAWTIWRWNHRALYLKPKAYIPLEMIWLRQSRLKKSAEFDQTALLWSTISIFYDCLKMRGYWLILFLDIKHVLQRSFRSGSHLW